MSRPKRGGAKPLLQRLSYLLVVCPLARTGAVSSKAVRDTAGYKPACCIGGVRLAVVVEVGIGTAPGAPDGVEHHRG